MPKIVDEKQRSASKQISMPRYMWETIDSKRGIIPRSIFIANILHRYFYGNTENNKQ